MNLFARRDARPASARSVARSAGKSPSADRFAALESLERRQLLTADLSVSFIADEIDLDRAYVPGDTIFGAITVRNLGPMTANGLVNIRFYASVDVNFDANDTLLEAFDQEPVFLSAVGPDSMGDFADNLDIPAGMAPGNYFLIVRLTYPNDQIGDTVTNNNIAVTDDPFNISWRVGDFAGRSDVALDLLDGDSKRVEFTWSGPGFATVTKNMDGSFNIIAQSTTSITDLYVNTVGGDQRTIFNTIDIQGSMDELFLPEGVFTNGGTIDVSGTLRKLDLATAISTADGNSSIEIEGPGVATEITIGQTANLEIVAAGGISQLTLTGKWSDTNDDPDLIFAPYILDIDVAGNFAAGLRLSAESSPDAGPTLGPVNITGQVGGNSWWVNGRAPSVLVGSTNIFFSASFSGILSDFRTTSGVMRGTLAAARIDSITAFKNIDRGMILAGANLGNDGALGGAGEAADTYTFGQIRGLTVGDKVVRSTIAAGLDPINGVFNDGDDFIRGRLGSKFGPIMIGGPVTLNSKFLAGKYIAPITINGQNVVPQNNPRFVAVENVAPTIGAVLYDDAQTPGIVRIQFRDNLLLNYATINSGDIILRGPGGFMQALTLAAPLPAVNGKLKTASFTIVPPDNDVAGEWDPSDSGVYTLEVVAGAIRDMNGNALAAGEFAMFTITL